MFGAKKLNGESKPVLCVMSYEDRFKEILEEIETENQSKGAGNSKHNDGNDNLNFHFSRSSLEFGVFTPSYCFYYLIFQPNLVTFESIQI